MNINCSHLCGRLTRDPELKSVGQTTVAKFGLAINRTWKDANGEKKEKATFIDIEAWGKTAELIGQYLTKGSECYVQGRLEQDQWEKDGVKHSRHKIVAELVQFGQKPSGERAPAGDGTGAQRQSAQARGPAPAAATAPAGQPMPDEPPF